MRYVADIDVNRIKISDYSNSIHVYANIELLPIGLHIIGYMYVPATNGPGSINYYYYLYIHVIQYCTTLHVCQSEEIAKKQLAATVWLSGIISCWSSRPPYNLFWSVNHFGNQHLYLLIIMSYRFPIYCFILVEWTCWSYCNYSGIVRNFAMRLVNTLSHITNPKEGRLEIYYSGSWGTVCDDNFTDFSATVVCASLGFG